MRITDETLARIARSSRCRGLPGYRGRGFRDRIRRSVLGDLDPDVLASTRTKVEAGHVRMDAVSAALLAHHGVNPAVAAVCGLVAATAEFDEGAARWVVTDRSVLAPLAIRYAGLWSSARNCLDGVTAIPETLALRAAGIPLRDVLSHPALDALPLTVTRIVVGAIDARIDIEDADEADLASHLTGVR